MMSNSYSPSYYSKKRKAPKPTKCPYCKKDINMLKNKEGQEIKVNAKPVRYIPRPDGTDAIITPKGNKRRGDIVNDGTKGYTEHVCRLSHR